MYAKTQTHVAPGCGWRHVSFILQGVGCGCGLKYTIPWGVCPVVGRWPSYCGYAAYHTIQVVSCGSHNVGCWLVNIPRDQLLYCHCWQIKTYLKGYEGWSWVRCNNFWWLRLASTEQIMAEWCQINQIIQMQGGYRRYPLKIYFCITKLHRRTPLSLLASAVFSLVW